MKTAGSAASVGVSAGKKEATDSKEVAAVSSGDLIIGRPLKYENLAVFPVCTREVRNDAPFITLDEGLKAGTVEVMEVGALAAANVERESRTCPDMSRKKRAADLLPLDEAAKFVRLGC